MAAAAARPSVRPPLSGTLPMMTPFTSDAKLPLAPLVTLLEMGTRSPATAIAVFISMSTVSEHTSIFGRLGQASGLRI